MQLIKYLSKSSILFLLLTVVVYFRTCHRDHDGIIIDDLRKGLVHKLDIWYNPFIWDQPLVIEVVSKLEKQAEFMLIHEVEQCDTILDTYTTTYVLPAGRHKNRIYIKGYSGTYGIKYQGNSKNNLQANVTDKIEISAQSRYYSQYEQQQYPELRAKHSEFGKSHQ